ncbi:GNAT family N-acetyltransferase [uncultured Clostridium sp.]|jgi:spore coat polysaccharide biosynthesis protein SpsF|uniref:GNAT family N-acetyltransferase n=1 Tax=uncultured Clostridium sp. TaxID=59620 RepID=UPI00262B1374|nr:GNAT family N-acetyltransferase [uncultured Clostridium sp.]
MSNVVCIIQARVGSTRLPNKIMKCIKGKTVLEHVIDRVSKAKSINRIVIATTNKNHDDVISNLLSEKGVDYYRGSEENVLERYYLAARKFNADIIIRVTSDCPLIDYRVIDKMVEIYKENEFDYYSNTIKRSFPRGLDVEVFSFKALKVAYKKANLSFEKEHVTPYIWKRKNMFKIGDYLSDSDNSNIRITLDTIEDFEVIKDIYSKFYKLNDINIEEVIEYLKELGENVGNYEIEQKKVQEKILLRCVEERNIDLLLEVRNDSEVRKNSFNSEVISKESHKQWFEDRDLQNNKYYILTDGVYVIGSIYLIKDDNGYNINYAIHRDFRGMGYGKLIITLAEKELGSEKIIAKVKKENYISNKIFIELGYTKFSEKGCNIYIKEIEV